MTVTAPVPPPPRPVVPPSAPGTSPVVQPVRPTPSTVASAPVVTRPAVLTPSVLSKPYPVVWDSNPILWMCVYRTALRRGAFSLGWWIMEDDLVVVAHTSDFGVFPPDSEEASAYDQYHPRLPGGRL